AIIFANWRGFSGGTRDMFNEFGAMIVDALVDYEHPIFIYIPKHGELRGGAWVVIDPAINPDKMEMYADVDARGGILEPPGIVEVKYRAPQQIEESTSCYVPETFPTPPKVLPPDQRMHELYVCELNSYLMSVARNPQAFQDQVEMRLHVRLGTPPERKPESLKQLNMAEDAAWVTVVL
ncbi:Acetyl-CoA carboxylase, mitochondrial, partial [Symbiodinium microadriaticum]